MAGACIAASRPFSDLCQLVGRHRSSEVGIVSSSDAWRIYRAILADRRIQFAAEPFALEPEWKKLSSFDRPMPKVWTDAYLAAFARSAGMQLVTLDKAAFSMAREAILLK